MVRCEEVVVFSSSPETSGSSVLLLFLFFMPLICRDRSYSLYGMSASVGRELVSDIFVPPSRRRQRVCISNGPFES